MSTTQEIEEWIQEENLIDFEVGSPEAFHTVLSVADVEHVNVFDNLLDSELVHLEETLQSASTTPAQRSRCNSIELEQVLITIDDDDDDFLPGNFSETIPKEKERTADVSGTDREFCLREGANDETNSVLNELDSILNSVDGYDFEIVECLRDLDEYLQSIDVAEERSCDGVANLGKVQRLNGEDKELEKRVRKLVSRSASLGRNRTGPNETDWGTLARNHRFRATISALRKNYHPKSDNKQIFHHDEKNSLDKKSNKRHMSDGEVSDNEEKFKKHQRFRTNSESTTTSNTNSKVFDKKRFFTLQNVKNKKNSSKKRRFRTSSANFLPLIKKNEVTITKKKLTNKVVPKNDSLTPVHSFTSSDSVSPEGSAKKLLQNRFLTLQSANMKSKKKLLRNHHLRTTLGPIEYTFKKKSNNEIQSDEEIDWSWVQELTSETENDHSQGVAVVVGENQPGSSVDPAPSLEANRPSSSSWLRSSMRRLQHFRLPSSESSPAVGEITTSASQNIVGLESAVENAQVVSQQRPTSAPVRTLSAPSDEVLGPEGPGVVAPGGRGRGGGDSTRSRRRAMSLSSSESSLASSVDSTPVSSPTNVATPLADISQTAGNNPPRRQCDRPRESTMPESHSPLGQWPHSLSSMLACLGCTLGLFNVSRFAILTVRFGANFILQFLILSAVFGIPLFTLQLCLGQQLGAGVIDMWRVSPLFQGVGIALLASQALIGLYSIVGISWMFIYFRDSFITKQDQYRWAQPFEYYREDSKSTINGTYKISETVPDYFSGVVLQRHNLVTENSFGAIKFQVAFNLAVVWMIVFVSLSKGLRSYAKVVYVFSLLPIFGTFVLCAKLLGMTPSDSLLEVFPETSWGEFFLNTKSWLAASQEAFLTWGLLGAAVMQIASHNKHKHLLQRDSSLVIILTVTILMLTAFLANTCIQILHFYGYNYMPNSFEKISSYIFLRSTKDPLPPSLAATPVRYMTHTSFIVGERVIRPGMDRTEESGYQVLRFATELVPATLAILGPNQISPFWAVLFYFILILFGIAQQLAIWHCVITGIMAIRAKILKSWETTITFFTCTFGFILGLPMTTEMGIYVVYFLDYCVGGVWWLVFVYLIQVVAIFMVRGRPYSGDTVVTALFTPSSSACVQTWVAPLLSFTWNVVLPVALMVVSITQFRTGNFKELFVWHHAPSLEYWSTWTRQLGSLLQLIPILCIPLVAIIQSYRYLNNGPSDILDRIQLLYRPPLNSEHMDDTLTHQTNVASNNNNAASTVATIPAEDPPPKYTPPPSYTTATGARIAKLLRQSIRRSVRRITSVLGESSVARMEQRNVPFPPPDYSTVLVEMNQSSSARVEIVPRGQLDVTDSRITREISNLQGSTLTAADVACILRSSFRRSTVRNFRRGNTIPRDNHPSGSLSAQSLVDRAAPLGEDSLVSDAVAHAQTNESEIKCTNETPSVI